MVWVLVMLKYLLSMSLPDWAPSSFRISAAVVAESEEDDWLAWALDDAHLLWVEADALAWLFLGGGLWATILLAAALILVTADVSLATIFWTSTFFSADSLLASLASSVLFSASRSLIYFSSLAFSAARAAIFACTALAWALSLTEAFALTWAATLAWWEA